MDNKILRKNLHALSESENSATVISCACSLFRAIFRPWFTMQDKKVDPKSKKIAAFRESLMSLLEVPLFAVVPFISSKIVKVGFKNASADSKKFARLKANTTFIGLTLVTILIPALCNGVQDPIMEKLFEKKESKQVISKNINNASPSFNGNWHPNNSIYNYHHDSGMRIG